MDIHGALATLRHGFKCYGRTLRVAYFKAAHELNPELEARYAANRLGLTRQLHFSPLSPHKSLVAFSGTVVDDKLAGVTYTEPGMNHGISEKELPEKFATQADQLFFDQIVEAAMADDGLRQAAAVNPGDKFELVFKSLLENLFVERMDQNEDIFVRFMNDASFQKIVTAWMASETYRRLRSDGVRGEAEHAESGTLPPRLRIVEPQPEERYVSEKAGDGDSWQHTKITLKPVNADFEPIVLTGTDEGSLQVVAEVVEVLGRAT